MDDYRDVDPKIGTLAQFDEMIDALHTAGIRVIADLVPNHSSDRHVWFREALAAPAGSPARARYIFRDGLGDPDEAALGLDVDLRRPGLDARRRRPVVPALVRQRAARLGLGQPGGARGLPDHAAVLVGPRRRRVPRRRGARSREEPARGAAVHGRARGAAEATATTRCGTATRCTRSTPSGGRCSTSTTRRASPWPRPGSSRRVVPATPAPRGWVRRSTSTCSRRTSTPHSSTTSSPTTSTPPRPRGRRRRGCSRTTTSSATRPATACPPSTARDDKQGGEWLLAGGLARGRRRDRPASGSCGVAVHARAARVGLPLPG